jgi:hypothetical protein
MQLSVVRQDLYSRGELLLRTMFGAFYIGVPHFFLWIFVGIWSVVLGFVAFWSIIFTGRYPQSIFEFQVKFMSWQQRVYATMHNLVDGYPSFGLAGTSDKVSLIVEYRERQGRALVIVRFLFGMFYVLVPHGFCLFFRYLATGILAFCAWWVVLFTGSYPATWHEFNVGTMRWMLRVGLYNGFFTDTYPPFSGRP